jgi:hypothetical protein
MSPRPGRSGPFRECQSRELDVSTAKRQPPKQQERRPPTVLETFQFVVNSKNRTDNAARLLKIVLPIIAVVVVVVIAGAVTVACHVPTEVILKVLGGALGTSAAGWGGIAGIKYWRKRKHRRGVVAQSPPQLTAVPDNDESGDDADPRSRTSGT